MPPVRPPHQRASPRRSACWVSPPCCPTNVCQQTGLMAVLLNLGSCNCLRFLWNAQVEQLAEGLGKIPAWARCGVLSRG